MFVIVLPTVKRLAYFSNSENVIQTLLCSDDEQERREGVQRLVQLRGEGDEDSQVGSSSIQSRKTPDINMDASEISDLIKW